MKNTSYLHNLSLIHLVTFASVIGSQIHVLSMATLESPEAPVTAKNLHFNYSGFAKFFSTLETVTTKAFILPSVSDLVTTSTSLTSKTLKNTATTSSFRLENKKVSEMNSNSGKYATTGSTTREKSSTTLAMPRNSKNSSKYPLDIKFAKNHWFNSDLSSHTELLQTASDVERPRNLRSKHHHEHHWGPFFEEPVNSTARGDNLVSTAHLFTEAALNCRVGMLKDKTVMWVRRTTEKVSLLTVGNVTYSGDPRIRVKFQYPNNWRLLINPAHWEDAGVYMCQVSTHPPRVFTTNLTILEPPLRLIDEQEREVGDRYYKSGSTIDLQCQISKSYLHKEEVNIMRSLQLLQQNTTKLSVNKMNGGSISPNHNELFSINQTSKPGQALDKQFNGFILWTKDDEPLPRTAIRRSSTIDNWLNSRISIQDARLSDSGNYSCSIGKLFAAVVQVQVLTGDAAYPLEPYIMTPYRMAQPGSRESNYNSTHAKARNIVERTIGLLKSRFRCLLGARELHYKPSKATKIANVCAALHNICVYYKSQCSESYDDIIAQENEAELEETREEQTAEGAQIRNAIRDNLD